MATDSVAFTSDEGPQISRGADLGFPDDCYIYNWVVSFFITRGSGLHPGISAVSGFVVQRVDVSKMVFKCDGTSDTEKSKSETVWETFKVVNGESEGSDTVLFGFPKDRRTSLAATFSASFHPTITGATRTPIDPMTNPGGADGTLDRQPDGFTPTLVRKIHISVDCCDGVERFSWETLAHNSWGTYEETWKQATGQERPERRKIVDGETVEPEGE